MCVAVNVWLVCESRGRSPMWSRCQLPLLNPTIGASVYVNPMSGKSYLFSPMPVQCLNVLVLVLVAVLT